MLAGLFSIDEDEQRDRLIFDRRPENATMLRLDWCKLPAASCFSHLLLESDEVLRGSGDDLTTTIISSCLPNMLFTMLSAVVLIGR